ncbi:hypothetical protein C8R43DRAFT_503933 [Mycena crocata]|nr:hypothetical protein C8R43DRAFT_503933 [Mycena crocata]
MTTIQKVPRRTSLTLRARLEALERQMTALESQMTLLRAEREEILQDLAAVVYPILTLPDDITSEIFLHCVETVLNPGKDKTTRQNPGPLCLASICSSWRDVAISTCGIWTRLSFRTSRPATDIVTCLQWWLSRAGCLPIDLLVSLPSSPTSESDAILRALNEYSSRFQSLDLLSAGPITFPDDAKGPFPALKRISLQRREYGIPVPSSTIPSFLDASHLRAVHLRNIAVDDWRALLPWGQLTTLHIASHDMATGVELLHHTPNLEVLVWSSGGWMEPPDAADSRVVLPRLHTINVDDESQFLLDSLVLPGLQHIHCEPECYQQVVDLIARSGCSPRKLSISLHYSPLSPESLSNLPPIREMKISCFNHKNDDFGDLFGLLETEPTLLPKLESLTIEDCARKVDVVSLARMLAARMCDVEGSTTLKSFRLTFDSKVELDGVEEFEELLDKDVDTDVQLALKKLRDLRSHGLNMDIHVPIKWISSDINSHGMIQEINGVHHS